MIYIHMLRVSTWRHFHSYQFQKYKLRQRNAVGYLTTKMKLEFWKPFVTGSLKTKSPQIIFSCIHIQPLYLYDQHQPKPCALTVK